MATDGRQHALLDGSTRQISLALFKGKAATVEADFDTFRLMLFLIEAIAEGCANTGEHRYDDVEKSAGQPCKSFLGKSYLAESMRSFQKGDSIRCQPSSIDVASD